MAWSAEVASATPLICPVLPSNTKVLDTGFDGSVLSTPLTLMLPAPIVVTLLPFVMVEPAAV